MAHSDATSRAAPRRDRPRRPSLPWGVVFTGVEDMPIHILDRCLKNTDPTFRTGPRKWTKLKQGGVHFQHHHAHSLLSASIPPDLFGKDKPLKLFIYAGTYIATAFAPISVSNEDILDSVVGTFKVKRWKQLPRGMNVFFSSQVALAKAVRDGATIKGHIIDFQVARRRPCSRCLSLDHKSCDGQPICNWCCSDEHLRAECKAEQPYCIYCHEAHVSRKCSQLKQMQIELQERRYRTTTSSNSIIS